MQQWSDCQALSVARSDWEGILDPYGFDKLLLEREKQASLIKAVALSANWQQIYEDEQAVLFHNNVGT